MVKLFGVQGPGTALRTHVIERQGNEVYIMRLQDLFKEGLIMDIGPIPTMFQIRTLFLNEKGLYSLAMHTRNPSLMPFKKWLIEIALPAVRRHGLPIGNERTSTRIREIGHDVLQQEVQTDIQGIQRVQEVAQEPSIAEHAIDFAQRLLHYPGKEPVHFVIDKNGDPLFPAGPVVKLFGFKSTQSPIRYNVQNHQGSDVYVLPLKDLYKEPYRVDEKSLHERCWPTTRYLNEKGLYSLAMHCRLPAAEPFKKWIIGVVLPAIRRHGLPIGPPTSQQLTLE